MTDLDRLTVSLTKHNAHKVAGLLKDHAAAGVFDRLDEVHAERTQARKNLSTLPDDTLPPVWSKVQKLGEDAIDALVLVAIIFSHRDLIKAMQAASGRDGFSGRIERGKQLEGKAYTNFVRIIDQLGYATRLAYEGVTFSLKGMFEIPGLGPLVSELMELKLMEARWDRSNSVAEEANKLGLHDVFGVSPEEMSKWLRSDAQPAAAGPTLLPKDERFFQQENEGTTAKEFEFKPGHEERDVDPIARSGSPRSNANRLHNEIQNKLYIYLESKCGAKNVGTEVDTGSGTTIDVVTQSADKVTFYEIKTGSSVRASIRQALPQLLEYAYWPDKRRAHELVIVSHLPITGAADRYINFLRREFDLPLSYKQFDLKTNSLL
jgi:hypothetical protein